MIKKIKAIIKAIGSKVRNTYITYRSEFAKIVWPARPELLRKTLTVIVVSAMFGVYIAILDGALGGLFTTFVGFLG